MVQWQNRPPVDPKHPGSNPGRGMGNFYLICISSELTVRLYNSYPCEFIGKYTTLPDYNQPFTVKLFSNKRTWAKVV